MENQEPDNDLWSRRRWLARLSLSFLIIGLWLAYTGFRGAQTHAFSHGRVMLCYVAAMLAFVLFAMGTRERHRPSEK
ncbi:MAG: hypothetical protein JWN51_3485 [Phycisphaerales bacterium]|jgi:hypothetical protein|nr:hypothetical protein [Phycisphaerales bacterium]